MPIGRPGVFAAIAVTASLSLSCARYYEHWLYVATAEKIDEQKLKPAERRAALLGCISVNSMFISSDFTNEISPGENVRLGVATGFCYVRLVEDLVKDPKVSADERAAVALAAERSILAVDPDVKSRLEWAALMATHASEALKEKSDVRAVDASLRASWYAARANDDEVVSQSEELWRGVRAADDEYIRMRIAQQQAMNAAINAAASQAVSGVRSAMLANPNLKPAQRQQLMQQERMQRQADQIAATIVSVTRDLAESRADLSVLLKAGVRSLPDVLPEIEKHVSSLKDWAAAGEVVMALDGVRRNERGAPEKLFTRLAKSFGAEVSIQIPELPPPPAVSVPVPAIPAIPAIPPTPAVVPPKSAADRLSELKALLEKGLINQTDFDDRKKKILEEVTQ